MNALDRFRLWMARGALKAAGISFVPRFMRDSFFFPSYYRLIRDGYKGNSAVFACISTLAMAFPEPPLAVWEETDRGMERVLNHPARGLLRQPNPSMSVAALMQFAITYTAIGGNCYLWKQRNGAGRTIALWPFHDGYVEPIPGRSTAEGWVSHYEFDPGDGQVTIIPREDIIHWRWMPDPEQPWRGIGPLVALGREVGADSEAADYVYSLLKNNAVPPVVVTLVEGEPFDEELVARLKASWLDNYGGENRGAPAFLEAGMKAEPMGFNLEQLAFEALRSVPEARIAAAFRVPPIIAGLSVGLNRSTFSNYAEARQAFAEDTLAPLWRLLASEISNSLRNEYSGGFEIAFDLNHVKALQENQNDLWQRADDAWTSGLATRAEARQIVGLEVRPDDDVFFTDISGAVALPATTEEPEAGSGEDATSGEKGLQLKAFENAVMVAFFLPIPAAQELVTATNEAVLPDGSDITPVNEIHITLAYLGHKRDLDFKLINQVVSAVAARWAPIAGHVGGLGRFTGDSGGGTNAVYASFDAPSLPAFRQELVEALQLIGVELASEHGFTPHITLAYIPADAPTPQITLPAVDLNFDEVVLSWGVHRFAHPTIGDRKAILTERDIENKARATRTQRARGQKVVDALRVVRLTAAGRMESELEDHFGNLASRIAGRVAQNRSRFKSVLDSAETKISPSDVESILRLLYQQQDEDDLQQLIERFFVRVMRESYGVLDLALEELVAFDLFDPDVVRVLETAAESVADIATTTRNALVRALQQAAELGIGVDDIVNGNGTFTGIRGIVEESYKNRARTIARTELGKAQNAAATSRYKRFGVSRVLVFDNGLTDDDQPCIDANGAIWTLQYAERHPLEHPNCTRAFAPLFD